MYKTTLYNRCTSVLVTPNKTSVHTTLINHCEYIYEYIQRIYQDNSTAFLYRFFISSRYILRYIPWYIPPCKPLVVYVSGYTMIKCVLYTCIYPPPHLYILFMYWGLCGLKILAVYYYYTPSGILTSPLIFTGSPFRYKTLLYQELFPQYSQILIITVYYHGLSKLSTFWTSKSDRPCGAPPLILFLLKGLTFGKIFGAKKCIIQHTEYKSVVICFQASLTRLVYMYGIYTWYTM